MHPVFAFIIVRIVVHFVARVLESSVSFSFPCLNLEEPYPGDERAEWRELHALEHRLVFIDDHTMLLKANLSRRLGNSL